MKVKNPLYRWSLTINAAKPGEQGVLPHLDEVVRVLRPLSKRLVIGKEYQSRHHYQIYISFIKKQISPIFTIQRNTVIENKELWEFRPSYDADALHNYCEKDCVVYDYAKEPVQDSAKDLFRTIELNSIQQEMFNIIQREKSSRSVFLFSDIDGNSGKTYFAKYLIGHFDAVLAPSIGSPESIGANISLQLNNVLEGYKGLKSRPDRNTFVIFDVTRSSPFLVQKDKLTVLASICESLVSGLFSSTMYGKSNTVYCQSGFIIPIIMTNSPIEIFGNLFSEDRKVFYSLEYKNVVISNEKEWQRQL